jgi:deazaflavin-dependent oxidoreductase (nitroreductase family)
VGFDTPKGTRGAWQPKGPLVKFANRLMMGRIRRKGAKAGQTLILTTVGRKTGQARQSPLAWFPDEQGWLIVASAGGAAGNPAWYYNLAAHPDQVTIEIEGRTVAVTASQLQGAERAAAWKQIASAGKQWEGYRSKTDREIPVIRLTEKTA